MKLGLTIGYSGADMRLPIERVLKADLEAVERLIRTGSLLDEVEAVCGPLA